jgi:hypothetical protein
MGDGPLVRFVRRLADERGNIGPMLALMMVPIVGAFAIASEAASWTNYHRAQQNAADSAAIAAALRGTSGWDKEAYSVATKYNYTTNINNVTVTPQYGTTYCPTGANIISGTSCWKVTVSRVYPIYLTRIVGFNGDTALGAGRGKTVVAHATTGLVAGNGYPCIQGLNSLTLGGGNGTDLSGCVLLSGGQMQCNGTNSAQGVTFSYALSYGGNASNCASSDPVPGYTGAGTDPYASTIGSALSTSNLASLCPSYQTAPATGITSLSSGANCYQGNVSVAGNGATITVSNPNTLLIIKTDGAGNGSLNLGNNTILTASGASMTVVWTCGSSCSQPLQNYALQSSGGTLDIGGPDRTSGSAFKGFTLVEDPNLSGKSLNGQNNALDLNWSGNGNSTGTLNISGLIYMPHGYFNVGGAIDHSTNGYNCLELLANDIKITGTNDVVSSSQCYQQGEQQVTVPLVALLH